VGNRLVRVFLVAAGVWAWGMGAAGAAVGEAMVVGDSAVVRFDFTLSVDGQVVDSSEGEQPMEYTHGKQQIIPGLERQLVGLKAGDERDITVSPDEGFGTIDPEAVDEVQKSELPSTMTPQAGMRLTGRDPSGRTFVATVKEVKSDSVVLDLNHPLASKTLNFHVKIVEVKPVQ